PTAWFAAAATPRSLFAPCMNDAVMPRRSEKMTRTVSSSSSVTPRDRSRLACRMSGSLIARADVVGGAGLSIAAHAAELEPAGPLERLGGGVRLGHDPALHSLGETVERHSRLGLGEILVVHVDQREAEVVDPLAELVVAVHPVEALLGAGRAVAVDVRDLVVGVEERPAPLLRREARDHRLDAVVD